MSPGTSRFQSGSRLHISGGSRVDYARRSFQHRETEPEQSIPHDYHSPPYRAPRHQPR